MCIGKRNKFLTCSVSIFNFLRWCRNEPATSPRYACMSLHAYMLSYFSRDQFFATSWAVAHQSPLSMGFSRQECWSGLPSSRGSSDPGIEPPSSMSPALAGRFLNTSTTWEAPVCHCCCSVAQLCPTLCNPRDCSMPGFPVPCCLLEFTQILCSLSQ